tara:strand:- start:818 stop:2944 length:2127 start_codon:yes stop_codon:yes gene_type:complete
MAEPTANYYVFQYLNTHEQRYNTMFSLALQEVQADYTSRMAQQEFLAAENKKLQTYVSSLERDLTDYITSKGKSSEKDADKELALMRMYIDLEKAKASQSSSAQGRKLDAERMARSKYEVTTGMQKAIVDTDTAFSSRASLAASEGAMTNLIKQEVSKIVVPERGTGNALAAAQQLQAKMQDTATRKGVGNLYNEAEVKSFIADHYGLGNFKPQTSTKSPNPQAGITNPFDYNIPALETFDVNVAKKQQYASTGGLSKRSSDVNAQLEKLRSGAATNKDAETAAELMRSSGDYGMLLRSISDDGKVSAEEFELFTDRMDDGTPTVVNLYEGIKLGAREGAIDIDALSLEDQLIYDDQFLRKLGSLDTAGARQQAIQTELKKSIAAPTYEDVTDRARELYNPIRQGGSPAYTTYTMQDPTTGESFQATGMEIMEMQSEFEQVLTDNPQMAANYRAVQSAYTIAADIKPPQAAASKSTPKYLGYQLYKEFDKLGGGPDAAERISKLAGQLATSPEQTEDILKFFHAYNLQATNENFKPHDSTEAEDTLLKQLKDEQRAQQEALQNARGELEALNVADRAQLKDADRADRRALKGAIKEREGQQRDDDYLLSKISIATEPTKALTKPYTVALQGQEAFDAEANQPLAVGGPQLNKTYLMPGEKFGYQFLTPEVVQFVGSDGELKGKPFKPGSEKYDLAIEEATNAFLNSGE